MRCSGIHWFLQTYTKGKHKVRTETTSAIPTAYLNPLKPNHPHAMGPPCTLPEFNEGTATACCNPMATAASPAWPLVLALHRQHQRRDQAV